jgi:hypothetical protein
MTLGLAFWIIMLVWLIFGFWQAWPNQNWGLMGGTLLSFILFLLLGWHAFGPPIHG